MKQRLEVWPWVAVALFLIQGVLWIVPQFRPGIPGLLCWLFGSDRLLWWSIALVLVLWGVIQSARKKPFWTRKRAMGFALLLVLAIVPFAFRIYPSSHDDSPSMVRFRVPLDGPITVGWGGGTPSTNYHVMAPDQRWAYDLLVTKDSTTHTGGGKTVEDYFCYGMPILAPADGTVHSIYAEAVDMPVGVLGGMPPVGNHIILEVAPKEYLFLCHLKPGSIAVKAGDRVTKGQVVAHVGNTGNTSEPHLHIHLQDSPIAHLGEGIPLYFHDYAVAGQRIDRGIPLGGVKAGKPVGQVIEHATGP
jgi:hypothetical protein